MASILAKEEGDKKYCNAAIPPLTSQVQLPLAVRLYHNNRDQLLPQAVWHSHFHDSRSAILEVHCSIALQTQQLPARDKGVQKFKQCIKANWS